MQKKYIALAVAALASGTAFAQSSVVFGGIVDMGYSYKSSHTDSAVSARSAIDQGGQDGSRLFWTATEDLGNGLSVSAKQEIRIAADYRGSVGIDSSVLTLAGKSWGAIRAGNYGSVSDDINGFSETGMGWGNGVFDMISNGTNYNVVGYVSPNMGGFQAKVNYATNDKNADDAPGNSNLNIRAYGVNGTYVANGLKLGASYQKRAAATGAQSVSLDTVSQEGYKQVEWMLSGGYTFGQFSVGAGYDREKNYTAASVYGADYTRTAWRVNGGFAITPNDQVSLSYMRLKYKGDDLVGKANGFGASYSHMLSKRTNVYASYGKVDQNDDTAGYVGYESMFKVGMRHQF